MAKTCLSHFFLSFTIFFSVSYSFSAVFAFRFVCWLQTLRSIRLSARNRIERMRERQRVQKTKENKLCECLATKWTRRGFECGILFGIAMRSLKIVKCVRVALHSSIETVHVNQSNQSIFRVEENNNGEKSSAKSVYCFTSLGCEVATGYCCCFESDNNFLALIVTFFRYLRWHGYLFLLIVIFRTMIESKCSRRPRFFVQMIPLWLVLSLYPLTSSPISFGL